MTRLRLKLLFAGLAFALFQLGFGQQWPQTRAEKTGFKETSHYDDVIAFLGDLQRAGSPISVQMIGTSTKGRKMPLVIASYPRVETPLQARRLGRPVVYIQANIHAGEVEGKEAILAILRRLSQEGPSGLLSKIVLLVTPIYNIDGNEAFGSVLVNRAEQDGPDPVGQRANGQGLDLNRDAIKAEAPETQAILSHVYNAWDPDIMMDLHTTDGTRHGWELTYSPELNPNTDPDVLRFTRDQMLPTIRRDIQVRYGLPLFDYGNMETIRKSRAWATYGNEGRYCTNYVGLRNRIAILSEATAFIPFRARVEVTDHFVTAVLRYTANHAQQILSLGKRADDRVAQITRLGVRFDLDSRGVETVLIETKASRLAADKISTPPHTRPTSLEKVEAPIYDRFKATRFASFPAGYLVPRDNTRLLGLLRLHGISMEVIQTDGTAEGESFRIENVTQGANPFQGHRLLSLDGAFSKIHASFHKGDFFVPARQPLGPLAFHILEPESEDGAVAWGFLGESFKTGDVYPVIKLSSVPSAPMIKAVSSCDEQIRTL